MFIEYASSPSKTKNNVIENGNKIGYTGEGCTEPIGWLQQRDLTKFQAFENVSEVDTLQSFFSNLPLTGFILWIKFTIF